MKQKEKYLEQTPIFTLDDPPADRLITTDEWDNARYIINRTLEDCERKEAGKFYFHRGLPLLDWFRHSLECRLKNAGFENDGREASLLALESIKQLRKLLFKKGTANLQAVKVYLHSIALMINVLRSGAIPRIVEVREAQLSAPKKKKNEALLKYCGELMKEKPSSSAQTLFNRIHKKEKAAIIDGFTFYRDDPDGEGEEKIYCISPKGKVGTVGSRAFSKYFQAAKKLER